MQLLEMKNLQICFLSTIKNQDSAYKEVMAMSATLETTNKKIDSMPCQNDKEAARMDL